MSKDSVRKSKRVKLTPKKYSDDAFQHYDILKDILSEDSDANEKYEPKQASDEDFDIDKIQLNDNCDEEIVRDDIEDANNDDDHNYAHDSFNKSIDGHASNSKSIVRYSVGLNTIRQKTSSKEDRISQVTGTSTEDLIAYTKNRDSWLNASLLPIKSMIAPSPYYHLSKQNQEMNQGLGLCYDQKKIKQLFQKYQSQSISSVQSSHIFSGDKNRFIIGNNDNMKLIELKINDCISLDDCFSHDNAIKSKRNGWILNFGCTSNWLEWVPNQPYAQYLCISYDLLHNTGTTPKSPFRPLEPRSSCLYIYEIKSKVKPKVKAIVSYNWNKLKQLTWYPFPVRSFNENEHDQNQDVMNLGLLGGIWFDGFFRILNINLPKHEEFVQINIEKALIEINSLDAVPTCFTWLSTQNVCIGFSNGSIGIWDIAKILNNMNDSNHLNEPKPWFYKEMHDTYIVNLLSGYPSRPNILFSTSINGILKMVDLKSPLEDISIPRRNRINQPKILWHDSTQQLIKTDETTDMVSLFLRNFAIKETLVRCNSNILDMSLSLYHSSLLFSCTNGQVGLINLSKKLRSTKGQTYKQTWFKYEWRRSLSHQSDNANTNESNGKDEDKRDGNDHINKPLGKFTEGFKIEEMNLSNNINRENSKNNMNYITIYERNQGINNIEWNPNRNWSTWACISTGDGLIRIEDLGID